MSALQDTLDAKAAVVTRFLERYFSDRLALQAVNKGIQPDMKALPALPPGLETLLRCIRYSTLQEGGKRFRPALAMMTAEALGFSSDRVLAFGAAVECVHTYSLVHDDLPPMDDDDFRRGQPTNHRVFGEAFAILGGDGLLSEAFRMIAGHYRAEPVACVQAIEELSLAAGPCGMVGGQAIDLRSKTEDIQFDELQVMHRMKTGALIRASAVGAAHLCFATPGQVAQIREYASSLGLAFQVTDDLLDYDPEKPEPGSYPTLLGVDQAKSHLATLTERCLSAIESWGSRAEPLRELARYNRSRMR